MLSNMNAKFDEMGDDMKNIIENRFQGWNLKSKTYDRRYETFKGRLAVGRREPQKKNGEHRTQNRWLRMAIEKKQSDHLWTTKSWEWNLARVWRSGARTVHWQTGVAGKPAVDRAHRLQSAKPNSPLVCTVYFLQRQGNKNEGKDEVKGQWRIH